ncbi:hypothetical protein ACK8N7_14800 [Streptomyces griseobrunneus]
MQCCAPARRSKGWDDGYERQTVGPVGDRSRRILRAPGRSQECGGPRRRLLALTACGGGGSDANATGDKSGGDKAAAATRSVEHDAGTAEKVPAQPKRIVSVSVTMTGHLLALDAPVIASQATPPSVITDKQGFFTQWSDAAAKNSVRSPTRASSPTWRRSSR